MRLFNHAQGVFFAENMSHVAPSLHNMIRLKIVGLNWTFRILETLEHTLVHAFETKIRRLKLQIYRFQSFGDATNFICHFSNLRYLDLNWVTWIWDNDPYTAPSLQMLDPLTVHTGEFPQGKVTPMLTWLHIQSPLPKLISATFPVTEFVSPYIIPSTFGETLQNLHFSGFRSITEESLGGICIPFDLYIPSDCFSTLYLVDLNSFGLELCTNLNSIHFDNIPLWYCHAWSRKWVPDTLVQVKSWIVTELVFALQVREEHELDYFDWSGVIDIILHSQFDQLCRVCVLLDCGDEIYPTVSRLIREDKFGVLHDQGILFVYPQLHRVGEGFVT